MLLASTDFVIELTKLQASVGGGFGVLTCRELSVCADMAMTDRGSYKWPNDRPPGLRQVRLAPMAQSSSWIFLESWAIYHRWSVFCS